jgi:hypothetical protein
MKNLSSINWSHAKLSYPRRTPRPFPGIDPLRWYVKFEYAKGSRMVKYEYRGKPCGAVAKSLREGALKYGGTIFVIEFDQDGVIASGYRNTPTGGQLQISDWNATLYRWYYPFLQSEGVMIYPWVNPMFRKKLTLNGKTHIAYDLNPTWATPLREDYRKWLSAVTWK